MKELLIAPFEYILISSHQNMQTESLVIQGKGISNHKPGLSTIKSQRRFGEK